MLHFQRYLLIGLFIWFIQSGIVCSIQPPPPSFFEFERQYSEARTAKEKFQDIWRMMTTTGTELPPYPSFINFLKDLNFLPLISGQNLRHIQSFSMFRKWRLVK